MVKIHPSWQSVLGNEFEKLYFQQLISFVKKEYSEHRCYPRGGLIFNAFEQTPFEEVKVVILGQDPYHGEGQAHGLCFSVPDNIPLPPSLKNIFTELKSDLDIEKKNGNLVSWANQGVLLLNATLTVRANQAGSHQNVGWETFTDRVIDIISTKKENVVFVLWGSFAQSKAKLIDHTKHFILKAPHPSPLSVYRGFYNSKPFSQTNTYLINKGMAPINWL